MYGGVKRAAGSMPSETTRHPNNCVCTSDDFRRGTLRTGNSQQRRGCQEAADGSPPRKPRCIRGVGRPLDHPTRIRAGIQPHVRPFWAAWTESFRAGPGLCAAMGGAATRLREGFAAEVLVPRKTGAPPHSPGASSGELWFMVLSPPDESPLPAYGSTLISSARGDCDRM